MNPSSSSPTVAPPFLGLAPFLRLSITGGDLQAASRQCLAELERHPDDASCWLNLANALLSLGERRIGLDAQAQALATQRVYRRPANCQPPALRLLLLVAPGDLTANIPLDCLLEDSDIELIFCYVLPGAPLPTAIPEHDVALVALSESDDNRPLLAQLESALASWPRPLLNPPQRIPAVGRSRASELLQGIAGLVIPPTLRLARAALMEAAAGDAEAAGCAFPFIVRPVDSHAGRDLARIASSAALSDYLARVEAEAFFVSPFIDYSGSDGLYRKFRIALVGGAPYVCHMAVSEHWMVHYVNAGMYADAGKRSEEARFMDGFAAFARRHGSALAALDQRIGLDYLCIDCAETSAGELLIFEVDHAMVVHSMDDEALFPYKQAPVAQLRAALRDFLLRRAGEGR